MTVAKPKNLPASVRHRLRNLASDDGTNFDQILRRYANERLLYRLLSVVDDDQFVLKGAMLWTVWEGKPRRPTRDVDLLCADRATPPALRKLIRAACTASVEPDGVVFDAAAVTARGIREGQDYKAVRIHGSARIESARLPLQIDVGFGDAVTPAPLLAILPPLLRFPPVRMRMYPPETVIAEKFDAMVKLALDNTRMKDFYDVLMLSETRECDGPILHRALITTFARRDTQIPAGAMPLVLTPAFAADAAKRNLWAQFLERNKLRDAPPDLHLVIERLAAFLAPLLSENARCRMWRPDGGWESDAPDRQRV
jgi:predicted nucleotidyltransferase component of viral defense system